MNTSHRKSSAPSPSPSLGAREGGDETQPFLVALIGRSDPQLPAWVPDALREANVTFRHNQCGSIDEVVSLAGEAQVLWTFGTNPAFTPDAWRQMIAGALPQLSRCRAILRSGSGTDNVPVREAIARGMVVANTPGATAGPVAEYAVALMLAVARQVVIDAGRARRGDWSQPATPTATSLAGKVVGLVGFGQIARRVARHLTGFDVRVLAFDPVVPAGQIEQAGVTATDLNILLAESDIVSLHCPLTDATRRLMGAAQFARMKVGSILINTSRGAVVDERALLEALGSGRLAGAGLDVLDAEPPPVDHPLLHLDHVIVTPHVAAFSQQIFDAMWRLSVETILDLSQGKRPRSCVSA